MSKFDIKWISEYFGDNKIGTVFDIGSHNGRDGLKIKRAQSNARVVSIEADVKLYNKMLQKKELRDNLEIYNFAICDEDGYIDFYANSIDSKFLGSGSIHKPCEKIYKSWAGMKFDAPVKVKSIRIDTLCKILNTSNIDIIHMDIQSAEYKAPIGLGELRPKMIFLEISLENEKCYENSDVSTSEKLTDMGYELKEKIAGDALWIHKIR
jgi:FkbM family methyltransferase